MNANEERATLIPEVRLGMLTPSSNTAVEPLTQALLAPISGSVSAHFSRFRVTQIALDDTTSRQFDLAPILAAADLLADARPTVIAWNGTSASWLGFERDENLCAEITRRTGVPATSAIIGLNRLLARHGVRRLALVTPYTADVQRRIIETYARIGVDVCSEVHACMSDNHSFADISEAEVAQMCRDAAAPGVDAVAIVCTNMRGPMIAAELESELDVPVLDSIAVTLWACLTAAGVPTAPLTRFGRLFAFP